MAVHKHLLESIKVCASHSTPACVAREHAMDAKSCLSLMAAKRHLASAINVAGVQSAAISYPRLKSVNRYAY